MARGAEDSPAQSQPYELPKAYQKYLDVSFLGERKFVQVGSVKYAFFQMGPLSQTGEAGQPKVCCPV